MMPQGRPRLVANFLDRVDGRTVVRVACGALAFAGWLLAGGCTEKLVQPPPPPTVFAVPDSIQQIFDVQCGFSGCHGGSSPHSGMQLGQGARTSWDNIVGVTSTTDVGYQRIAPGDSTNSYIVMKLRNDSRILGNPMPLGGYPMDPALTMRIAVWAQSGAPGTPVVPAAGGGARPRAAAARSFSATP
jgi:hypothetical protein